MRVIFPRSYRHWKIIRSPWVFSVVQNPRYLSTKHAHTSASSDSSFSLRLVFYFSCQTENTNAINASLFEKKKRSITCLPGFRRVTVVCFPVKISNSLPISTLCAPSTELQTCPPRYWQEAPLIKPSLPRLACQIPIFKTILLGYLMKIEANQILCCGGRHNARPKWNECLSIHTAPSVLIKGCSSLKGSNYNRESLCKNPCACAFSSLTKCSFYFAHLGLALAEKPVSITEAELLDFELGVHTAPSPFGCKVTRCLNVWDSR